MRLQDAKMSSSEKEKKCSRERWGGVGLAFSEVLYHYDLFYSECV